MSKRIWHHPEVPAGDTTVSWRSVGQLEDTAEFRTWLDREFPQGAAQMESEEDFETSRRTFLKLMGASTALAGFGLAACRRPENYIVPYAKAPEWVIPGKATYYASSMPAATGAIPLVVTSFEGRPTKVAPNTLHPDVRGTDAFAQASVLDLYSPSRSRQVLRNGQASSRADFEKVVTQLAGNASAKVGFVFGSDDSPTRTRLAADLAKKFGSAKFYSYEALEGESAKALGAGNRLVVDYTKADRVVTLDSDVLCLDSHGPTAAYFNRRKPEGADYSKKADEKGMNRLYAIETSFSMTGGMADHRLRVAPSQVIKIAAYIASALGVTVPAGVETFSDAKQISWLEPLIADLKANAGKSAVIAGSRLPAAVQMIALAINQSLGNLGAGKPLQVLSTGAAPLGDIAALTADLNSGAVETLILFTPSNPVYDAPSDLKFLEAFSKAKTSIHFGLRTDATAQVASWHVPVNHYLESWSDARTSSGVHTIVQPMILPLYSDCVSELEFYVALLADGGKLVTGEGEKGAASPAYAEVRKTFTALANDSEEAWKKFLHDGYLAGSAYKAGTATADSAAFSAAISAAVRGAGEAGGLEVIFATDGSVYDGRWIDNGWLQEAPDPISKLTWDNAALIAPKTAKDLGIYDEIIALQTAHASVSVDGEGEHRKSPLIKVTVNGVTLEIPVLVAFGQAENTVVIPLGYGQGFDKNDKYDRGPKNTGTVGLVGVNSGFNAYPLRTAATAYFATGAKVDKSGDKRYPL
ncbi:MAG: hydrogenase, partial [Akkermansiaceae bacterium]|nr:hydrogenase [Akkermansiaceae bacterium]